MATTAKQWKKASGDKVKGPQPLDVPSGNTALVRVPGVETFMKLGMVPNSLLGLVTGAIEAAKRGKKFDPSNQIKELSDDPSKIGDLLAFVDRVVCYSVIEPTVTPMPEEHEDQSRDPELLYVDEVDSDDKFFIFQFVVGGSRDLERFRAELDASVATVLDVQDS